MAYCGRFAPTPSGPLHFGSLIAALGSYLDAKAHAGRWLVRIEDVDKPRAQDAAADTILMQLEQHGLHWDGEVIKQSQRDDLYQHYLQRLHTAGLTYRCDCSRRQIKANGLYYSGYCRHRSNVSEPYAIRFCNDQAELHFTDRYQGRVDLEPAFAREDFVLKRRDQLYAYQLAVVVDDIEQGVTDIVRGSDLLLPSSWQLSLWQQFTQQQPRLMHLPLALDPQGRKLSKQNHAPALDSSRISENLFQALQFLTLEPDAALRHEPAAIILEWALQRWSVSEFF
ncbi:tRNA glutamyl-Q(34) synthetase GluQRS [Idiomarina xiamenensis]|uniref:Glutamyl-Q tRNA(Asp) synthetase n=1 Tax=Idiomarina xiamenensis 10-D-4 TaxID=740709 RepID=K2KY03_9GAMM|nr:tRNA glutamyl-Q(34) synthetase GluQRS [Idiomarina xiamenensis]EKE87454.1 glutamyl-tRNA synthetase [Idiomarina xiamenensis 10-D-4]